MKRLVPFRPIGSQMTYIVSGGALDSTPNQFSPIFRPIFALSFRTNFRPFLRPIHRLQCCQIFRSVWTILAFVVLVWQTRLLLIRYTVALFGSLPISQNVSSTPLPS